MEFLKLQLPRKPPPSKKGEVNYALFDRFTFVHFAIGVGYGLLGFSFLMAIALALIWELIENPLKVRITYIFPRATADTLKNSIGDGLAVFAGWGMSHYF
jgi:hypothetical protein